NVPLLFTENETNHERLFPGSKNESPFVKDGINNFVVNGEQSAVNPARQGTKVAAHYRLMVKPGKSETIRLRLAAQPAAGAGDGAAQAGFGPKCEKTFATRLQEADEFYRALTPPSVTPDVAS